MPENIYQLELSPAAKRDLKKLPIEIQKSIVFEHLASILENPFLASKPLVGALKGEKAYHFGRNTEYRYSYFFEQNMITIELSEQSDLEEVEIIII